MNLCTWCETEFLRLLHCSRPCGVIIANPDFSLGCYTFKLHVEGVLRQISIPNNHQTAPNSPVVVIESQIWIID